MKKRGLVLVGGGACGELQGGALYAMAGAGLLKNVSVIVGTSVGSLNMVCLATGLLQGNGVELLKQVWSSIQRNEDIYQPGLPDSKLGFLRPTFVQAAGRFVWGPGFFDVSPLDRLVQRVCGQLSTDRIQQELGIELIARAYHYNSGQVHSLQDSLYHLARASSAIEGAFPAHLGYGDGGVGDNAPITTALARGCEEILVCYCGPESPALPERVVRINDQTPDEARTGLKNVLDVVDHITACNENLVDQAAQRAREQGVQIIDVYPTEGSVGSALDFTKRGLWDLGLTCGLQAVLQAQQLDWAM